MAKKGASTPLLGPEPYCGISLHELKGANRRKARLKTIKEWIKTPGLRQSKIMVGGYNARRAKDILQMRRIEVRAITGFLTGHCRLGGHLKKIGVSQEGECRFCNEAAETPQHILQDCMAVVRIRWKHLGVIQPDTGTLQSLEVGQILKFLKELGLVDSL